MLDSRKINGRPSFRVVLLVARNPNIPSPAWPSPSFRLLLLFSPRNLGRNPSRPPWQRHLRFRRWSLAISRIPYTKQGWIPFTSLRVISANALSSMWPPYVAFSLIAPLPFFPFLRPHLLLCLQSPQQKAHYAFLYASQHDHRSAVEARNVAMAIHMADQRAHGRDSSRRWFGRRRSPVGRVKSLVGTLRRQVRRSISLGKQRVLSPSVHGSGWREKHTPAFGRYGIPWTHCRSIESISPSIKMVDKNGKCRAAARKIK